MSKLTIIGRNTLVDFIDQATQVPAKVDTGADSSAVWVSDLIIDPDHTLRFKLFDKDSPYYTGEQISTDEYTVSRIRSSTGHEQIRYRAKLKVLIAGQTILTPFTLADRSKNHFPVLIGRRTLAGKFLVDVSLSECDLEKTTKARPLNDELTKNPHEFYKKYHLNNDEE